MRSPISDEQLVDFLKWALPRLKKRWAGFRKPRAQVKKRLGARIDALGLESLPAYRQRLESAAHEWRVLDFLTRVTISRFHRNAPAWRFLAEVVLPERARAAEAEGRPALRAWSAGCASGEEPYTLRLLWDLEFADRALDLEIRATDVDPHMIERARTARYPASSIARLPESWRARAFEPDDDEVVLRPAFRQVTFEVGDVRTRVPPGPWDIVFCAYTLFIYVEAPVARAFVVRVATEVAPGAALVVGAHEDPLAAGLQGWLQPWDARGDVFQFE